MLSNLHKDMTQVDKQLKATLEQFREMDKVNRHLDQLNTKLNAEYKNMENLAKVLDREQADVDKLEKMSLKGVFYKILGSKEEQLEKERQEYLQASLKYNELVKSVELLEFERKVLEEKAQKFTGVEAKLKKLMSQRERHLKSGNSVRGQKLLSILAQIEQIQKTEYEIKQAIDAGTAAIQVLAQMAGYLRTARNWGQWDTMNRRGRMSSYVKHSNIDKARRQLAKSQNLLWRFEQELSDVFDTSDLNLKINLESFNGFIDIFFDNLISDWIIQQRIRNSYNNVVAVHDKVKRIILNLQTRINQDQTRIDDLESKRSEILLEV